MKGKRKKRIKLLPSFASALCKPVALFELRFLSEKQHR